MLMSNLVDTVWERNDSSKLKKNKTKQQNNVRYITSSNYDRFHRTEDIAQRIIDLISKGKQ